MTEPDSDRPAPARDRPWLAWRRDFRLDRYGLLLLLLFADLFLLLALAAGRWATLVAAPFVAATLLLALRTSRAKRSTLVVAQIAGAAIVNLAIVNLFASAPKLSGAIYLLLAIMLIVTLPAVLRRVMTHRIVDFNMVMGAVCVYVLLGLVFAFIFLGIDGVSHTPFFAQGPSHSPADYLYMSFVTITTVGFGDLTAATRLGRALVIFEALIGQVFLVTTVARLVSLYGLDRPAASSQRDATGDDD
jgi:hypothetical protein